MKYPECNSDMDEGFLYVRGMGASLAWRADPDTRFYSKKSLELVNLTDLSRTPAGAQAVLDAPRCSACGLVVFRSKK